MRLNVGCGEFYAAGWTNLDVVVNDRVKPDLVGSLADLPAAVEGVEAVYLGHVLEHLPEPMVVPALRKLWERCVLGCQVAVVGPDVIRAWDMAIDGHLEPETAQHAAMGARRWRADKHWWASHEGRVLAHVVESGLGDARPVFPLERAPELAPFPVVSGVGWQCAVVGTVGGPR